MVAILPFPVQETSNAPGVGIGWRADGRVALPSDLSAIQSARPGAHDVGGVLVLDGPVSREAVVERLRRRIT